MKIDKREISVRDIIAKYVDNEEEGCFGYNGLLNIRPAYQREFVYKEKQRNEVIRTIQKGYPLNVIYWGKNSDGTYDVIDGQQRILSICQFVNGDYSLDYKYFTSQYTDEEKEQILDYKLEVFVCEGTESEKLEWFRIINIAGAVLTDQELRNAAYTGKWLASAKSYFSKSNCPAYNLSKDYVKGNPIRQDLLETALDWISNGEIEDYMSKHSKDENADELWDYYKKVIKWVSKTFPTYYKEMKGLNWGKLYNLYKDAEYNPDFLDKDVKSLMADEDVTKKSGIFEYLLSGKDSSCEKLLSLRAFTDSQKRTVYENQNHVCPKCGKTFKFEEMEGDHIVPWSKGGKTTLDNLQMLCKTCNKTLSNK